MVLTPNLRRFLTLERAHAWRMARIESQPLAEVVAPADLPAVTAFMEARLGLVERPEWADRPFQSPAWGGSRFSDGTFGVFYAGMDPQTCAAEVAYHQTRHLKEHGAPAMLIHLLALRATVSGTCIDIRRGPPALHRSSHTVSRPFGARAWKAGADGIAYRSVRRPGGECLAVFRRDCILACHRAGLVAFTWDGSESGTELGWFRSGHRG